MRRAIRTNLLVVCLVALSVGVGVYAAVVVRSQETSSADYYRSYVGNSDFRVELTNPQNPDQIVKELERLGMSVLQANRGSVTAILPATTAPSSRAVDPDLDQLIEYEVVLGLEGRKPVVAGEIAMTRRLAAASDIALGDTTTSVSGAEVTVVGLVQTYPSFDEWLVYLPAGSLQSVLDAPSAESPESRGWVTFGVTGASRAELAAALSEVGGGDDLSNFHSTLRQDQQYFQIESKGDAPFYFGDDTYAAATGALVSSVMLFQAGVISAVAFIVSLRRRTFDIGRLSAVGAEPVQLRRMLTAEAALLGFVGAVVGIAGGLSAAYLHAHVIEPWILGDRSIHVFEVEWALADLFWPGLLAVIAAMSAMWFPARWAANLSPEEARNGGYKQRRVPRWLVPGSSVVLVTGLVMLVVAAYLGSISLDLPGVGIWRNFIVPLSGIPLMLGAAGLVYAVMGLLYRGSFRLPLPFRLSTRDGMRNPIRSVGAVTAYMVLLTFLVAIFSVSVEVDGSNNESASSLSQELYGETSSVAMSENEGSLPGLVDLANPAERVALRSPVVDADFTVEVEQFGFGFVSPVQSEPADLQSNYFAELTLVGTPELLDALDVSDETRLAMESRSTLVVVSPTTQNGETYQVQFGGVEDLPPSEPLTIQTQVGDPLEGLPILLIPPALIETNDWPTTKLTLLYRQGGFSDAELDVLYQFGFWNPGGFYDPVPFNAELVALLVVSIFILVLSRILSALAGVDSANELASAMAVGAPANFRRTQLAWQTGYGVGLAVVAAVLLGHVVAMAYAAGSAYNEFSFNPSWTLLGGILMLPLVSASFIFLTTRSAQPNVSHRLV